MSAPSDEGDVGRFRAVLSRRLGLSFAGSDDRGLAETLGRCATKAGVPCAVFLERLSRTHADDELREVIADVTVGETYFFRHLDQLRAFAEVALPERLAARAHTGQVRVLSAACSTGEEAYSLAMLSHDAALASGVRVSTLGVDVNEASLARARRGRYAAWSLREAPPAMLSRWFGAVGRETEVAPALRTAVTFARTNLAEDDEQLWTPNAFDVVFCRNALMYFTRERAAEVIARIAKSLTPGGYLFLGHAETLRDLSNAFDLEQACDAFFYRRREGEAQGPVARDFEPATGEEAWVDVIDRSAERIHDLDARPAPGAVAREMDGHARVDRAIELLGEERYAEALEVLSSRPEADGDAEPLLLRAVLFTQSGALDRAERACLRLLDEAELGRSGAFAAPFVAGAHYLLALCSERAGDTRGADAHDRLAVDVDPTFAMPRLHLGLLARRAGDKPSARRELMRALMLLDDEDRSRLLFFGGGFGRDGLVALCRAELAACGGDA